MPSLGDLVVNLSANTSKFDKGISRSKQGMIDFGSVTEKVAAGIKASLIAATGGAIAAAGAIYGLTGRIGDLASLGDRAAQTGLSGAFLQRLEFAADQSGVSIETLQAGMKRLMIEMGKSGETMPLDQKLAAIGNQMANAKSQAERVKIATDAFGKAGVEMTGLFAGGMSDLNHLLAEAQRLGIGIDDEALARAAAADDAIQKMKFAFSALVDQVAVTMAPAFETVANKATELLVPINEMLTKFNQMEDRWTWLKDVMVASFNLGFEMVQAKWSETLKYMADSALEFGKDLPKRLAGYGKGDVKLGTKGMGAGATGKTSLDIAQGKFDALMAKLNEQPGAQPAPEQIAKKPDVKSAFSGLWESIQKPITDIQAEGKQLIDTKLAQVAPMGGMLKNWFDGMMNQEPKKTESYQSLSAAKAGSSEALSTILYSSFRQGKNPQVQATQHQTKQQAKQHAELMNVLKDGGLAMMGGWP